MTLRRGTNRIESTEMQGANGLRLLSRHGHFCPREVRSFSSIWRQLSVDGICVGEWTTSPIAGECSAGCTPQSVIIVSVMEGVFQCTSKAGTFDGFAGTTFILAASQRISFTIPQAARLLRIEAPATIVSSLAQQAITTNLVMTETTHLTTSLMLLVEAMLDPHDGGANSPAARALQPLTLAVLNKIAPPISDNDKRDEIVSFIEAHLAEPDLSPSSIANAFGISIRWAHYLFDRENDSIARHIRNRRIDIVAAQLRTDRMYPRVTALMTRSGFSSRDQLTRAFKARYGMTLIEYYAAAADGLAPHPSQ